MRSKLLLMLSFPVAGLLLFAGLELRDNLKVLNNITTVKTLTGLAVAIGDLSHEIQKERGLSAGYLNAQGGKFRDT